jgi:hypothetical protein
MHNIKTNFDKIHQLSKIYLHDFMVDDTFNFQFYRHKPKMNDCEIISLAVCAEALSIDSENLFWKKLKSEYTTDFTNLIDRSNYNKRRRRLQYFIQQLNEKIAHHFTSFENVFIVDSIPIPICQLAREKRSKICKAHFETAVKSGEVDHPCPV